MNTKNHYPKKLVDTDKFIKNGYYNAEIIEAGDESKNGKDFLKVDFSILKGRYTGFTISERFDHQNFIAQVKLSFLCKACDISADLKSPDELVGKKVKIRVFNKKYNWKGKIYRNATITRFHSLKE